MCTSAQTRLTRHLTLLSSVLTHPSPVSPNTPPPSPSLSPTPHQCREARRRARPGRLLWRRSRPADPGRWRCSGRCQPDLLTSSTGRRERSPHTPTPAAAAAATPCRSSSNGGVQRCCLHLLLHSATPHLPPPPALGKVRGLRRGRAPR